MRSLLLVGAVLLAAGAGAQLKPAERNLLDEGLALAGVRPEEIAVPTVPGGALAASVRKSPADAFDALTLFGEDLLGPLSGVRTLLADQALGSSSAKAADAVSAPSDLPPPIARLAAAVAEANSAIRAALSSLTPAERRLLIEGLPSLAGRSAGIRPEFATAADPNEIAIRAARAKVDVPAIRRAGLLLARKSDAEWNAVRAIKLAGSRRLVAGGVVVLLIGDGVADVDARDAGLVVVTGGSGRITGRAGAGIGYASLLLDARPRAEASVPDAGPGTGLLGIGIARFGGDLVARGGILAFGSGVAGYGELRVEGAARLSARAMAEGYGDAGGVGLLSLGSSRDDATLGAWGQGAGRDGGVGALLDAGGDDRYEALGVAPDEAVGGRESDAQGYGESGGLGVLADAAGDDAYAVSARGQGAGEGGGVGLLYDRAGDDDRRAFRFAQGAGDRGGVGLLADLGGSDAATLRRGEGQAAATRGGVGLLFDRSGDDLYAQGSGSPGSAQGGGVALFLDGGGEDALTGRIEAAADGSVSLLAFGGAARGIAPNVGGAFAGAWIGGAPAADPGEASPPAPGSLPPDRARIERAAGLLATRRGGYREAAVRELSAFGVPGVEAALARMNELGEEGLDALARVIATVGEPARRLALAKLGEPPSANALRLAGMARLSLPGSAIAAALDDSARRRATILALADGLPAPEAAGLVLPAVLDEDRGLARAAMRAVLRLGGETEASSVRALVTTNDPTIRAMAWSFVARRPGALDFAKGLLADNDPARVAAGIGVLAAEGSDEALRLAGTGLNSPSREVRIAALRALAGRIPAAWRARTLELQNDPDPAVRRAALAAELGP